MSDAVDVLVAVPARDEAARIEACLRSVLSAIRLARLHGVVDQATVAVAAHRCRDDTAARARRLLDDADVDSLVWEYDEPAPVGVVRTALVQRSKSTSRPEPVERPISTTWLFSTDADTIVPTSWITTGLRLGQLASAGVVVGLVDLLDVHPQLKAAHDQLVRAGVAADGSHAHVYAANLAVRMDVFDAVGGFPSVPNGEEHALLAAVEAAGHPILRTIDWRVRTSGRTHGRARDGLGDLLGRLAQSRIQPLGRPA